MHLKRSQTTRRLPIPRKGTKYVARAQNHSTTGISIVAAIRDMLKLARTSKEVKQMINNKLLKINGKQVTNIRTGLRLFNTLTADQTYTLSILPTGRFTLEQTKDKTRLAKITNRHLTRGGKLQLSLHDGTSILSNEKATVNDTVELDEQNKITKIHPFKTGNTVIAITGASVGKTGTIQNIEGNHATIKMEDKTAHLETSHLIVIK